MPTFLIVILSIVAFIALVLTLNIKLNISYDGALIANLQILFVKIKLYPLKEKHIKLKDYRIKNFRKNNKPKKPLALKEKLKGLIKKKDELKKEVKSVVKSTEESDGITENLENYIEITKVLLSIFGKHLKIRIKRIIIIIGGNNAATTAVKYGIVVGLVQNLTEVTETNLDSRVKRRGIILVDSDFTSTYSKADVSITFSLKVWQILHIGLKTIIEIYKQNNS